MSSPNSNKRRAECHPERLHEAHGQCANCYVRDRRAKHYALRDAGLFVETVSEKICTRCKQTKAIDEFGLLATGKAGRHARCKSCSSEDAMARNDVNPDIQLNGHLRRRFGITLAAFNELLESQNGVCAICGEPPTIPLGIRSPRQGRQVRPRLVVDHDHETGRIRGLLCTPCNRGIGFLGDNAKRVLAAAEYLERAQ